MSSKQPKEHQGKLKTSGDKGRKGSESSPYSGAHKGRKNGGKC